MTLFQIIMVALMSLGFLMVLGFSIAFIVEAVRGNKPANVEELEEVQPTAQEEYDIRQMLAQLEETSTEEEKVEEPEETEPVTEVVENNVEETQEEVQLVEEKTVEEVSEPIQETEVVEEVKEESVEEKVEEVEKIEETTTTTNDEDDEDDEEVTEAPKTIVIEKVTTETVGTDFDYNVRLAKIVESKNKMERDLQKTKRAITKYERTQRRRARNQKMLDRRAVELTNLNLMMYSVTDIKNVDADKKAKQEELTTHIAELKASIQDADLFLAKNRERYEHDKKMYAFYTKEEARYNDEIKELEILIKNANNVTGSTTTTTTTTTTETAE